MSKHNIGSHVVELTPNCRELKDHDLDLVTGGGTTYTHQRANGSAAGNVAAKWNLAQGHAA